MPSDLKPKPGVLSFCETVTATGATPWHLRRLSEKGCKYTGGADTPALCGRTVCWDVEVDVTAEHLKHACRKCVEVLNAK